MINLEKKEVTDTFPKKKSFNKTIFIFALLIALMFILPNVSAVWWNASYNYYQAITITENFHSTDLINYTFNFRLNYNSNMQSDFDDIRFMGADNTTVLGFYIVNKTDSNHSNFDILVPNIVNNTNTLIYMYYGNAGVTTTSNRSKAYWYFDDFNRNDWTGWTKSTYGDPVWVMGNGFLNLTYSDGDYQSVQSSSYWNTTLSYGYKMRSRYMPTNVDTGLSMGGLRIIDNNADSRWFFDVGYAHSTYDNRQNVIGCYDVTFNDYNMSVENGNYYIEQYTLYPTGVGESTGTAYTSNANPTGNQPALTQIGQATGTFGGNCGYQSVNGVSSGTKGFVTGGERGTYGIDWVEIQGWVPTSPTYAMGAEEANADTTPPTFTNGTPLNITQNNSLRVYQKINATDETGFGTFTINDSRFSINSTGIFTNTTALPIGITWINVTINDSSNNKAQGLFYVNITDVLPPVVTFSWQLPWDITSDNAIVLGANMTYNITSGVGLNLSRINFYYKINSTTRNTIIFVNGTNVIEWNTHNFTTSSGNSYQFWEQDNDIYPATYNLDDAITDNNVHTPFVMGASNTYIATQLLNVTNTTRFNFFEIMSNSTSIQRAYYCNSSYQFNSDPSGSPRCSLIATIPANQPYNHSHTVNSKHQVIPLTINTTTGRVGTVQVTPTSWFMLRGNNGAGNNVYAYTVSATSRIGAIRTTTDNGNSWTNQTYTTDAHLHQFSGNSSLYYYVCANDTLNQQTCSSIRQDLYELGNLPPSSPTITYPMTPNLYVKGQLNITYLASVSPNNYPIIFYNVSLDNNDYTYNRSIANNNSQQLNYSLDTAILPNGVYRIAVHSYDSLGQSGYAQSENFTVDNTNPTAIYNSPADGTLTNIAQNFSVNITDDFSGIQNATLFIYNDSDNVLINSTTISFTDNPLTASVGIVVSLIDGIYKWFWQIFDNAGNQAITSGSNRTLSIDTTNPVISITAPTNTTYNRTLFELNYTVNDLNLQTCWYSYNGGINTTLTCGNNVTGLTVSQGTNVYEVFANDTVGNYNSAKVQFEVDSIIPALNIVYPANTSWVNSTFSSVNYTVSDVNLQTCWANFNNVLNMPLTCGSNFTSIWLNGQNNITIFANDSLGNVNSNSISWFYDDISPSAVLNAPANNSYKNTNQTFSVNATDNLYIDTVELFVNNTSIYTFTTSTTTTSAWVSSPISNFSDGIFNWYYVIKDKAGNLITTNTYKLILDFTNPVTTFVSPTSITGSQTSKDIIVNVTFSDTNIINNYIYLYNSLNALINSTINNSATGNNFTFSNLADGIYYINSTSYDKAGNNKSTETRTITIYTESPSSGGGSGGGTGWITTSTGNNTQQITILSNFSNITLFKADINYIGINKDNVGIINVKTMDVNSNLVDIETITLTNKDNFDFTYKVARKSLGEYELKFISSNITTDQTIMNVNIKQLTKEISKDVVIDLTQKQSVFSGITGNAVDAGVAMKSFLTNNWIMLTVFFFVFFITIALLIAINSLKR